MGVESLRERLQTAFEACDYVTVYRESTAALKKGTSYLGADEDDVRALCMQSASHLNDTECVKEQYAKLHEKYPNSIRLDRLGIYVAAAQHEKVAWTATLGLAKSAIEKDPAGITDRRILLGLMKHRADSVDIFQDLLEDHLEDMPADSASWRELAELCVRRGRLYEARIAYEELALLLEPGNIFDLVTLADVCMATDALTPAFKYYSLAVSYDAYSQRALWGILTAYGKMKEKSEEYKSRLESAVELARKAARRLSSIYEGECAVAVVDTVAKKSVRQIWLESCQTLCGAISRDLEH